MYKSMLSSDLPITIATKYPKQTLEYFCKKGKNVNLVILYGSIELAPLVNLAHAVVDLVSTGRTLKANGLVEVELIKNISSRLIINKASLKLKDNSITEILEGLRLIADERGRGKTIMIKKLNSKQESFKDDFLNLISVSEPDQAKFHKLLSKS